MYKLEYQLDNNLLGMLIVVLEYELMHMVTILLEYIALLLYISATCLTNQRVSLYSQSIIVNT